MKKRLDQLLGSLGYGSRNDVKKLVYSGAVTINGVRARRPDEKAEPSEVRFKGEVLDPLCGMVILMNKPVGVVCSHDDTEGKLVYSLLPQRWQQRSPKLSTVGRLDKDTSGLLLITDDGALIHALTSPKKKVSKLYEVELAEPINAEDKELFASGTLMLKGEKSPCLPARLDVLDETHTCIEIMEGRYHQVRRMFAAAGNKVVSLHRSRLGMLELGNMQPGEYRILAREEIELCTQEASAQD
jgi:16S rRNA pseudouridine516 synthase